MQDENTQELSNLGGQWKPPGTRGKCQDRKHLYNKGGYCWLHRYLKKTGEIEETTRERNKGRCQDRKTH